MPRTIAAIVKDNEKWRSSCLNLIASENVTSPKVREMLASDLGHRYTLPFNREINGAFVKNAYMGTRYTDEMQARTQGLACEVFGCKKAYVNALSGHIAAVTAILSLCKKGDLIIAPGDEAGGYHGWTGPYLPDALGMRYSPLPFNPHDWDLDYAAASEAIITQKPTIVVLGMSYFPFPLKVRTVREACDRVGAYLVYDASHVLGLVAGGQFQQPLKEGADVMLGSTHKSFFGPQGGVMLTNDETIYKRFVENSTWRSIDNAHWNRIAALGQALEELKKHGKAYASQVVKNSKALANAMASRRVPMRFAHRGYTESHQVLMDDKKAAMLYGAQFPELADQLEANDIIIDNAGRLGTSEVTRLGMKEKDMDAIASLIVSVWKDGEDVRKKVNIMRKKAKMRFC